MSQQQALSGNTDSNSIDHSSVVSQEPTSIQNEDPEMVVQQSQGSTSADAQKGISLCAPFGPKKMLMTRCFVQISLVLISMSMMLAGSSEDQFIPMAGALRVKMDSNHNVIKSSLDGVGDACPTNAKFLRSHPRLDDDILRLIGAQALKNILGPHKADDEKTQKSISLLLKPVHEKFADEDVLDIVAYLTDSFDAEVGIAFQFGHSSFPNLRSGICNHASRQSIKILFQAGLLSEMFNKNESSSGQNSSSSRKEAPALRKKGDLVAKRDRVMAAIRVANEYSVKKLELLSKANILQTLFAPKVSLWEVSGLMKGVQIRGPNSVKVMELLVKNPGLAPKLTTMIFAIQKGNEHSVEMLKMLDTAGILQEMGEQIKSGKQAEQGWTDKKYMRVMDAVERGSGCWVSKFKLLIDEGIFKQMKYWTEQKVNSMMKSANDEFSIKMSKRGSEKVLVLKNLVSRIKAGRKNHRGAVRK